AVEESPGGLLFFSHPNRDAWGSSVTFDFLPGACPASSLARRSMTGRSEWGGAPGGRGSRGEPDALGHDLERQGGRRWLHSSRGSASCSASSLISARSASGGTGMTANAKPISSIALSAASRSKEDVMWSLDDARAASSVSP